MKSLSVAIAMLIAGTFFPCVRAQDAKQSPKQKSGTIAVPADESAQDAMIRVTKVMETLDLDAAAALYECANKSEQDLARAYCKSGIAITRIELAARKQFGKKQADEIIHAIADKTDEDLEQAKYKVEGDRASIQFAGDAEPGSHLVRVKGIWKIDIHPDVKDLSADELKQQIKQSETIARDTKVIAEKLEKGEYKRPSELLHDLQPIVFAVPPELLPNAQKK